jgi:hypothetical protein
LSTSATRPALIPVNSRQPHQRVRAAKKRNYVPTFYFSQAQRLNFPAIFAQKISDFISLDADFERGFDA